MDNVGRGWGDGVSAAAMALSVAVLVAGTSKYRYRGPAGSTSDPPRKWGMPGEDVDDAIQRCCSDPDGRHGRSLLG
ncbi:hypothetical protein ZWY2020_033613 [Hordeum vulgare]|nr:hypothetical protein ZWY2020_033613 [Hordeum vulgare]